MRLGEGMDHMLRDVSGCGGDGSLALATRQMSVTLIRCQWFLKLGTAGQLDQPLTSACADVQFRTNKFPQGSSLTSAEKVAGLIIT